jgi:ubiquinone/menaquinone biosynthesis C-methylase UbiE
MAARFDAARFGGPIGTLLLEDQERALFTFLGDVADKRILDIGTGTGRAAIALAKRGARVTGIDASVEMLSVARRRVDQDDLSVHFAEGDVHALSFPERAFDGVVCFRVLMHVPDWRKAIAEVCRVAQRRVVLDYPAMASAAVFQAVWRRAAFRLGRPVEAYRVFSGADIRRELARHGFQQVAEHRQFVLPIALHKAIGSPPFTRRVEGALAGAGVLSLLGSPVTIAAERCAS